MKVPFSNAAADAGTPRSQPISDLSPYPSRRVTTSTAVRDHGNYAPNRPATLISAIDSWGEANDAIRSEAIRRLVELGLTVQTPARPASKSGRRLRARELATTAIEKIIDPGAAPEEQAQRRRRLTKGPAEFREARVDQPRAKGK